jgi:exodeoxyribonuclease V alpha subunit
VTDRARPPQDLAQTPTAMAARALAHLRADGALRAIDGEFAALLQRRFGADALVALAGALAMRAVALGHSGFALSRADALLEALSARAELPPLDAWGAALTASPVVDAPAAFEHRQRADASKSDDGDAGPAHAASVDARLRPVLLSFEYGRVSLRRYARYEQALAEALAARCAADGGDFAADADVDADADADSHANDDADQAAAAGLVRRLFALQGHGADTSQTANGQGFDRQAFAAWRSLRRQVLLITGGPGTGKTTTVARLLALHLGVADARGRPGPRIALAAPTGRAAVRLAEAIAERVAADLAAGRIDPALAARVPRAAQTLHRLLGPRPGRTGFRHHAGHPLPFDLVVVDEASMIDLPLMTKLVAAVAPDARLVLLGDPDQLPAVEAGDVLGRLCEAAGEALALDAREAEAARALFGPDEGSADAAADAVAAEAATEGGCIGDAHPDGPIDAGLRDAFPAAADLVEASAAGAPPLAGHRVHLLRGWRQAGMQSLQALTEAVRRGDRAAAMAQFERGDPAVQRRHGEPAALADWLRQTALPGFVAVAAAADPAAALQAARRLRLLTALRRGPYGAEFWNAWCAAELAPRDRHAQGAQFDGRPSVGMQSIGTQFHGRLIAIASNHPRLGLYNGDLGVLWRDREDGSLQAWFEIEGGLRAWRPGQLPPHASAFASTVHKAQGAEFETVALLLPDRDSRVLGRELLYTALTRARRQVLLWAAPGILERALQRRSLRDSGLSHRLRAASAR